MEETPSKKSKSSLPLWLLIMIILPYIGLGYLFYAGVWVQKNNHAELSQNLQNKIADVSTEAQKQEKIYADNVLRLIEEVQKQKAKTEERFAFLENEMETKNAENKKIYVYNLEDVLRKVDALETKKHFEDEILKLNDELNEAEQQIKTLKTAKVKEDFTGVYLKNLRMKRDDLINDYEKNISELTGKINKALDEIAKEKDISTIFVLSAVGVQTPHVINVTDEIVEKMKK